MHHLMLASLTLALGGTSDKARQIAYSRLLEDHSFCGQGGRLHSALCDWFVIGGRWSGYLSQFLLGQAYEDALAEEFPEFVKDYYSAKLVELHKDGLDQLWQRFGGTGPNPITRSSYDEEGAEDDAMVVDRRLYDHFLKPLAGKATCVGDASPLADFIDLDGDEVDESFIGRKWLVVVDYHS